MLIGEDVRLRRPTPADAELVASWWEDPAYRGEYYNVWPSSVHEWSTEFAKEGNEDREAFYLIVAREREEPIGTIGYVPYTVGWFRGLELWWQVHPSERGRGVASRATCLLVNHLFDAIPVERLQATMVVGNEASRRVAENAGMQIEGVHRGVFFVHGQHRDMWLYSILRSDWLDDESYRISRRPF